mmetsp:Transcript_3761/g.13900  ORF Transcript_3761/g.13900 Transcript_3761/m.13900 type:complete len:160 (+) Transcript_3761:1-480(+)
MKSCRIQPFKKPIPSLYESLRLRGGSVAMFRAIRDAFTAFRRQGKEFDAIKAQRSAMQAQLEAYKADSAAQLRATEAQTLQLLNGLVERLELDRGKLRLDKEEVRRQVRNIEAALQGELSVQMQEKMNELMRLAAKGEYNVFDPNSVGVKRSARDTETE